VLGELQRRHPMPEQFRRDPVGPGGRQPASFKAAPVAPALSGLSGSTPIRFARNRHALQRTKTASRLVEGLIRALDSLPEVIEADPGGTDAASARASLQDPPELTERPAESGSWRCRCGGLTSLSRTACARKRPNCAQERSRLRHCSTPPVAARRDGGRAQEPEQKLFANAPAHPPGQLW